MITGSKMPIINYKKKFNEALKIMNKKKLGIVVVTKNQKIEGLITDGNLRRGMKLNIKERKLENFMDLYGLFMELEQGN